MKQDRYDIFRLLNVPPRGIFVTGIHTTLWGREFRLSCIYDPDASKPFLMIFKGVHSISWTPWDDVDERDSLADVIGIILDTENRKCIITTDVFEISISYGELLFEKDW